MIGVVVFIRSVYQLYLFKTIWDLYSIQTALSNMVANTGSINILAATLTIKIPFLFAGIIYFSDYKKWFLVFTLLLVTTVILMSGSRSAMISLFLIYTVFIFYYLKIFLTDQNKLSTCLMVLVPLLLALFITNTLFKKVDDNSRYGSIETRIKRISAKDQSSNFRLLFWKNAIKMTKSSPVTGVGLGNYKVESIPYEKFGNSDGAVSTNVHNDFLEIFAETGVLNGLIYFSLILLLFITNTKKVLKTTDEQTKAIAITTLLMVIVYGVDSFFNFPMFKGTMVIAFCLLFVLTVTNEPTKKNLEFDKDKNNLFLILAFVAITTSYFAFLGYKASHLESEIKADKIKTNNKRIGKIQIKRLTGDYIASILPKYPNVMSTTQSFSEYVATYYVQEKKYEKASKYLSEADKINPYLGGVSYQREIIAIHKGNIDSAYIYAKEGLRFRPKNLKFYQVAMRLAGHKKDTSEILKEYRSFTTYTKSPKAWNIAINQLRKAGYDERKLAHFIDQSLKEFPDDKLLVAQKRLFFINHYINEGKKYQKSANYKKALESFQKALSVDPKNVYTTQYLGFYYYVLQDYNQAIPYFARALKYPGLTDGKAEFFLAACYLKIKNKENACKYFNLSKAKNYPIAQKALSENCK